MIIMKSDATREQISAVVKDIENHGLRADVSQGDFRTIIGLIGDERKVSFDRSCHVTRSKGGKNG